MVLSRERVILFAGIGFSAELYRPQRGALAGLEVPGWISPEGGETLAAYGKRMAGTIRVGEGPVYLGGVSFGGAVALEVARHVPTAGVFLIASARSYRGIPWYLRAMERGSRVLNDGLCDVLLSTAPWALPQIEALSVEEERWFLPVFRSTRTPFLRWALAAMTGWEFDSGAAGFPIHQIHGDQDQLVPLRILPEGDVEEVVPRGRHLINVTHARRVNRFIAGRMGGLGRTESRAV